MGVFSGQKHVGQWWPGAPSVMCYITRQACVHSVHVLPCVCFVGWHKKWYVMVFVSVVGLPPTPRANGQITQSGLRDRKRVCLVYPGVGMRLPSPQLCLLHIVLFLSPTFLLHLKAPEGGHVVNCREHLSPLRSKSGWRVTAELEELLPSFLPSPFSLYLFGSPVARRRPALNR